MPLSESESTRTFALSAISRVAWLFRGSQAGSSAWLSGRKISCRLLDLGPERLVVESGENVAFLDVRIEVDVDALDLTGELRADLHRYEWPHRPGRLHALAHAPVVTDPVS